MKRIKTYALHRRKRSEKDRDVPAIPIDKTPSEPVTKLPADKPVAASPSRTTGITLSITTEKPFTPINPPDDSCESVINRPFTQGGNNRSGTIAQSIGIWRYFTSLIGLPSVNHNDSNGNSFQCIIPLASMVWYVIGIRYHLNKYSSKSFTGHQIINRSISFARRAKYSFSPIRRFDYRQDYSRYVLQRYWKDISNSNTQQIILIHFIQNKWTIIIKMLFLQSLLFNQRNHPRTNLYRATEHLLNKRFKIEYFHISKRYSVI